MKKLSEESGLTCLGEMSGIKATQEEKSVFIAPKIALKKKGKRLTEQQKDYKKVPKELRTWVFRPEIASQFAQQPRH